MNSFPAHVISLEGLALYCPWLGQLFQPIFRRTKVEQKIKSRKHKQAAYCDRGAKV